MEKYKILLEGGQGEVVEKKSRFIATVRPVQTEAEATAFIEEIKKQYWDARHNCSAFVIGKNNEITRCSDDGEPSGTAGRPMLEVLLKEELHNAAVVVTRYFGGTLLGTGGLVRAYSASVKEGLQQCKTGFLQTCSRLVLRFGYNEVGKIQNFLADTKDFIEETSYTEQVSMTILVPAEHNQTRQKQLVELCAGKIRIQEDGTCESII